MIKTFLLILFTLFLASCATEKVIPVGKISKITASNSAVITYPESSLQVG